jgi:SAM-dependent methyltransferase
VALPFRIIAIALAGLGGLGGLGWALLGDHRARQDQILLHEGRRLYWQQRRTEHVHEPYELLNQLFHRAEDDDAVLGGLELARGAVVADVGCGSGFYTFELARRVGPEGRVYATDVQDRSLAFLDERIAVLGCARCGAIELVHNRLDDLTLPPESLDAALMAHLDFHTYHPMLAASERMLGSVLDALRPGGRLVVVQDMRPVPGGRPENIERNLAEAGFEPVRVSSFDNGTVLASFRKPDAKTGR